MMENGNLVRRGRRQRRWSKNQRLLLALSLPVTAFLWIWDDLGEIGCVFRTQVGGGGGTYSRIDGLD